MHLGLRFRIFRANLDREVTLPDPRLQDGAPARMVSARQELDGTVVKAQGRDGASQARPADGRESRQSGIVRKFGCRSHKYLCGKRVQNCLGPFEQ